MANVGAQAESDDERHNQEQKKALEWLDQKWTNGRICPIDGNNSWTVHSAYEMREFRNGDLHLGGQIFPVFGVSCVTCGFTHFFSAILAGVAGDTGPEIQ